MVQKIKRTPDPSYYISKELKKKKNQNEIKGEYFFFINNIMLT